MKGKLWDHLFYLVTGTLYTYALARSAIAPTTLTVSWQLLAGLSVAAILCWYVIFFNRVTVIVSGALVLLGGGGVFLYLYRQAFAAPWFREVVEKGKELALYLQGYIPLKEEYNLLLAGLFTAGIALLMAVFIKVCFNFYVLAVTGVLFLGIPIYLDYNRSNTAFCLTLFCVVVFSTKKMNLFTIGVKGQKRRNSGFAMASIPVAALLVAIAWFLPKLQFTVDNKALWEHVDDRLSTVGDLFTETFGRKYFSFQFTGFGGGSGALGGRVNPNNRYVMEVFSDERVYLGGAVKDLYTGRAWEATLEGEVLLPPDSANWRQTSDHMDRVRTFLFQEMEDDIAGLDPMDPNSYINGLNDPERFMQRMKAWATPDAIRNIVNHNKMSVTIFIGEARTMTLFSPSFDSDIWMAGDMSLYQDPYGSMSTGGLMEKNTSYTVDYVSYGNNSPESMETLRSISRTMEGRPIAYTMQNYLALPETLPDRVHDLAVQVTAGLDNDYDRVKALEEHLSGYRYSLSPGFVPPGEDFVDHFLFIEKEGYCTYYASALAVMARTLGIPTRYVEGFVLPQERGENGGFTVTNSNAHAWTEAYIQGFGWVPFEATAPFVSFFYDQAPPAATEVFSSGMLDPGYEEYLRRIGYQDYSDDMGNAVAAGNAGNTATEAISGVPWEALLVLLVLLVLCVGYILIRVIAHGISVWRIDRLSNREAVIVYYGRLLRTTKAYGYSMRPGETAITFAKRLGRRISWQYGSITMNHLAELFSRAAYSAGEISDRERATMRDCYRELLTMHRDYRMRKPSYLFNRYVLARF